MGERFDWADVAVAFAIGLTVGLLVALFTFPACAAPPPGSDPNSDIARWFHSLTVPDGAPSAGGGCCDVADCRPVDYKQDQDGYHILIGKQFGEENPHWELVPPEVILHNKENPIGQPVACYYMGRVRCFVAPPET